VQQALLLLVICLTSAGAYLIGTRRWALPRDRVGRAIVGMFQVAGTAMAFFVLNVTIGLAVILLIRSRGIFVSVYLLNDTYLPILSVIQAVIFECWRGHRTAR